MYDLLLLNGQIMTGDNTDPEFIDIGIKNGKIDVLGNLKSKKSSQIINCNDLTIIPGVIDTQVHFRDPGLTHKEDIETGSKSAVLGGVTAFCEMPNTIPLTDCEKELSNKIEKSKKVSWCDFAYFIGATEENISNLNRYEKLSGCAGVKIFMGSSTGDLLVENEDKLLQIMSNGERRVAVHAEDERRLKERFNLFKNSKTPHDHPKWRDPTSALLATKKIIKIAYQVQRPLHILHVSTSLEMKLLKEAKDIISVEVTPQHLTLNSPGCYDELGTFAQMNPPIRTRYHQKELWEGIYNGTVDVIGSDHAPHTIEEKNKAYPSSPSGMPGVQTMLPVMLDQVYKKNLKLSKLVSLLCSGPAEIYKMKDRGKIKEGYNASLTIVDLKKKKSLKREEIKSRCGWSPFLNKTLTGWPVMTIISGVLAMNNHKLLDKPLVKPIEYDI